MSVENHCRFPATLPVMRDPGICVLSAPAALSAGTGRAQHNTMYVL